MTWWVTIIALVIFLVFDVWHAARNPHVPSTQEAARHLAFYVALAILFGLYVLSSWGARYAGEYYAGWLTEYSCPWTTSSSSCSSCSGSACPSDCSSSP
jgi:tellurite resistance protein TerC